MRRELVTHTHLWLRLIFISLGCMHVCVLRCFRRVQLFAILWTVAHQAPLAVEFSRQEYWSELPCPPSGDLPILGSNPRLLHCRRILYR